MEKEIVVDGKKVKLRATAMLPRLYRFKFGRDIMKDFVNLYQSYQRVIREQGKTEDELTEEEKQAAGFSVVDLELFENVAYVMAKHGDPENVPDTADEWLMGFDTFSIYEVLPAVMELWMANNTTTVKPKKKNAPPKGN